MKILFCDLCNESVPQSELDEGRAFMRKGRVVCGRCDALMTARESAASAAAHAAGPMGGAHSGGAFASSSTPSGAFGGGSNVPPTAASAHDPLHGAASLQPVHPPPPGHGHGHPVHHHHPRPQRSGSGVVVGIFAMLLTAGAFYWLTERTDKLQAASSQRIQQLESAQHAAELNFLQRTSDLEGRVLRASEDHQKAIEDERKAFDLRLNSAAGQQETALKSMGELRSALTELAALLPTVQRHENELLATAQRLTALDGKALALENAMIDVKKQLELRPGQGNLPVNAPVTPTGAPAWMGLVQQLESANNGDRWVAVQSLGETRDPAVAEYLLPRLKDVDIFVRMATARVLGDLGSPKAVAALIDALGDQDSSVREAAYVSLTAITKKSLPFDAHQEPGERAKRVKAWQDWWKKAQEEGAAQ